MPIYVYDCKNCQRQFEEKQPITSDPVQPCPQCNTPARRVIQPVGIIFKGSGWYKTDNRSGSSTSENGSSEKSDKKSESNGKESVKSESSAKENAAKEGSAKESSAKEGGIKESSKSESSSAGSNTTKAS
ncbi:MAG: FmdB family transcriptional regulator [Chloroflexi bacterium]|nr:FmdB family transcriptional regulator [Chloroflexota bacterium]